MLFRIKVREDYKSSCQWTDLREALRKKWNTSANRPSSAKWDDIDQLAQSGASKVIQFFLRVPLIMADA